MSRENADPDTAFSTSVFKMQQNVLPVQYSVFMNGLKIRVML